MQADAIMNVPVLGKVRVLRGIIQREESARVQFLRGKMRASKLNEMRVAVSYLDDIEDYIRRKESEAGV